MSPVTTQIPDCEGMTKSESQRKRLAQKCFLCPQQ